MKDQSSKDATKLSQSFHHLSVQNQLPHQEIEGLKEALAIKKKQKNHRKPLDLQQRQEYHGGAVIWSPRKIRDARACKGGIEREEKEQRIQKVERAELEKAAQLCKLKIAEETCVAREAAKVVRRKEKAKRTEKAAQRARDRQARNAEKALQLSQSSKRTASQLPSQKRKHQKHIVDAEQVAEGVEAVPAASAVTIRRGRNVTLPSRY